MKFGSVCSGIEAASVAWHPLGWKAAWLAEIEPFPCALLAHHYPDVPNLGDMTTIARRVLAGETEAPEVLTGGTPCQAFSVAGLRESLADQRGNLTLKFVELADAIDHVRVRRGDDPCIVVWENVPGVLSTKDNAFGCFLAGLAGEDDALEPPGGRWADSGCVYGPARAIAWRTLDAQYFGLAQRRRRVFVVASARNGFDPAAVLFEWQGVRRDSAPSREAGQRAARPIAAGSPGSSGYRNDADTADNLTVVTRLTATYGEQCGQDYMNGLMVPAAFAATNYQTGAFDQVDQAAPLTTSADRTRAAPILAFSAKDHGGDAAEDLAPTLRAGGHSGSHANAGVMPAIAFDTTQMTSSTNRSNPQPGDPCHPLAAGAHAPAVAFSIQAGALRENPLSGPDGVGVQADHAYTLEARAEVQAVASSMQVRRLTPRECERLQGFPDDYTLVPHRGKPAADGPRYKALGNSWAVPVARWIGGRIQQELETPCKP